MIDMKTYRIPNTDLDVTRLGYGTASLGGSWDQSPITQDIRDRADVLLHTAVDNGINFIDLADVYTWGKSNKVVGEVIKNDPAFRDQVILQSKAGIKLPGMLAPDSTTVYDFSYENLTTSVETTLQSLNTDYLDILLLHRPDALVEPDEVARAFDDLQSSGKVRYFGVSNQNAFLIELLQSNLDQPLVVNQVELNLLHNDLINDGLIFNNHGQSYSGAHGTLDYCRANDIMIQAWSPVAKGKLFNPPDDAPENLKNTSAEINRLADKHDTTPSAIALAWLLRHPAGIQPILGTRNPDRIPDSVKADEVSLSRLEWYTLLEKANGVSVP